MFTSDFNIEGPRKKAATYDDIINAPEHLVAEILNGELFLSRRGAPLPAYTTTALRSIIHPPFHRGTGGPGGWIITFRPEVHIAGEVFVPDLAGWKRARLPRLPETHFTLPPDWVCEVRAPSNESDDRSERLRIYARERISHAWLVDPARRLFEVLRLEAGRWSFVAAHKNDEIVRAEPFEAIEIELSRLWAEVESAANGQEQ